MSVEVEEAVADDVMVAEAASAEEEVSLEAAAARTTAETEATSLESSELSILTSAQNCCRARKISTRLEPRPREAIPKPHLGDLQGSRASSIASHDASVAV